MSTVIRLKRTGTTKRPCYRVVVIDKARANKGGIIENLGTYNSRSAKKDVPDFKFDSEETVLSWLKRGAKPSESVKSLLVKAGVWQKFQA